MKKLLILILISLSLIAEGRIRWVTPRGSDTNTGADSSSTGAWATWGKAFSTATAGDTVYFRGGIYNVTSSSNFGEISNSGVAGNYINFWAYPIDFANGNFPILEFANYVPGDFTYAIKAWYRSYLHFKGLTIRNLYQRSGVYLVAIYISGPNANNVICENMTASHIGGVGMLSTGGDEISFINCDVDHCIDTLSINPGNNGIGIGLNTRKDQWGESMYDARVYAKNCRAWNCGDAGFAIVGVGYSELSNSWSWGNGAFTGGGSGLKYSISTASDTINPLSRNIHHNIFANNGIWGMTSNNAGGYTFNGHYYNNFFYHNGYHGWTGNDYYGVGIWICNSYGDPAPNEMYFNNLSYDNEQYPITASDTYIHTNNSWDQNGIFTITDDDFISLDTLQLLYPRKSDGSLPDIDFGRLRSGSDLIDAGKSGIITRDYAIALTYIGDAPDLGYAEYEVADSTATDILTFTLPTQTGAATINAANHTVSIEVNYLATITNLTPYISLSYGATISPESMVSRDFTTPQTYTVTALDGTTTQEWVITVTQEEEPYVPPEVDTSRMIKFNGGHLRKFRP